MGYDRNNIIISYHQMPCHIVLWHDWLTTTTIFRYLLTSSGLEKYYDKSALGRTTVLLPIWRRLRELDLIRSSEHQLIITLMITCWSLLIIWESGLNLQRNGSKTRKTVFLWKKPEIICDLAPAWVEQRICLPYIYLNSTLATVLAALSATWWSLN